MVRERDDLSDLRAILAALPAGEWRVVFTDMAGNDARMAYLYRHPEVQLTELRGELGMPAWLRCGTRWLPSWTPTPDGTPPRVARDMRSDGSPGAPMDTRLLSLILATACSTAGPGSFDPPFAQTSMRLTLDTPDESVGGFTFDVTGSREVGGVEVPVVSVVDPRVGTAGAAEALVSFEAGELILGGFRQPDGGPGVGVDVQFDTPVIVDLGGALGEPQTVTVEGTLVFGDPTEANPGYLPFDLTFTPEEDGVVSPTPMGDVPGCRRSSFTAATTGGISVSGALWTKEAVGVVRATLDAGPFGQFEIGTEGWTGFDDIGGRRLIQAEQRLDATTPSMALSTYDIDGDFLADKDTHAQMWLELRFADADRARTTERPQVSQSFGTIFGFFPSELAQTNLSILHPEDAEEGFTYWIAAVDEAAKNESENGIAYNVQADWSGGEPVLAAAFVRYRRLE